MCKGSFWQPRSSAAGKGPDTSNECIRHSAAIPPPVRLLLLRELINLAAVNSDGKNTDLHASLTLIGLHDLIRKVRLQGEVGRLIKAGAKS